MRPQAAPLPPRTTRVGHKLLLEKQQRLLILRHLHRDTRDVRRPAKRRHAIHIWPGAESAVEKHDVDVAPPTVAQPHVSGEMWRRACLGNDAVRHSLSERAED